jgi:anti-sigma-K factor RskA
MSHWSRSPTAVDALASEYVLGTLRGPARRRFEAAMTSEPAITQRVRHWEGQLHRLGATLAPVQPSAALWARLASEAGVSASPAPATTPARPATPEPRRSWPARPAPGPGLLERAGRWWQSLLQPLPAGALAFGLMAGLALPLALDLARGPAEQGDPSAPLSVPASYIGVLATPDGRQGLIVASLRRSRVVELKQVVPLTPPPGTTLYLWAVDPAGQVRPVGAIPSGPFVRAPLPDIAERVFSTAVELAVTAEPLGTSPAVPGGAFLVRGLCGKVWPPAPAASQPR